MIPEEKKRHKLTQVECDMAKYLLEHGQTLKEIGEIIGVDPSTVGKIRLANYDLETYLEQRKAMNRKTKERKAAEAAGARRLNELLEPLANPENDKKIMDQLIREEQAAGRWPKTPPKASNLMGQMEMDLDATEEKKEPDEQTKQMRFQAALMDKLLKKLDELIDVLKGGGKDE